MKILVVDDEENIRTVLKRTFQKEGFYVTTASSGNEALKEINETPFDLVITDLKMPDGDGLSLIKQIHSIYPETMIMVITAYGSTESAVEAMKSGAFDYIIKPINIEELRIIIRNALEKKILKEENIRLKNELIEKYSFHNLVGRSKKMREIFSLVEKIAPTNSTVLITGESGTGKELVAKAIHYSSPRREEPFVSINCGALPEALLESELFGHVKGSFTGAYTDKKGLFEIANKGTILLDEISEMSLWMQVKLLRVLQERKIRRVGGIEEREVDVRIIASTNVDLSERIKDGRFREDLFYRLNVIRINLPPLRERKEDIQLLVKHFIEIYSRKTGKGIKSIREDTLKILESYHWPGNVRELENCIERAVIFETYDSITPDSLDESIKLAVSSKSFTYPPVPSQIVSEKGIDFESYINTIRKKIIEETLKMSNNELVGASRLLNMSYRSLRYYIKKLGIKTKQEK
ncbi:MAG: sigma-54-dependent transcriptional regulator [Candidatus Aminicenantia bacterium]